ncbi:hypothetical protein [Nocardioides donggukensis]|uniref:Uncharacterized protein n=1 Tax=Nocardioides donggukensis TaxID=2774019 RepID=A0A927KAY4_9ACTN|nr:hypothetical protein [Nocardioides donggukensis]MBD8870865.1 hypothetical protein [Nocardioides donggukensis]
MSPSDSLLLPDGARLVHIGPHKTGSTAVQVSMIEARAALAGHGAAYVGFEEPDPSSSRPTAQRPKKAGWALGIAGRPAGTEAPDISHWHDLVAEVEAAGGSRVCISNEDFGRARPQEIRRVVDDLGGDAVHVVAVARRLDRYLPSQWQERVKAGERRSYAEWLRVVLDRESEEWDWDRHNVWHAHDTAQLVRRWVDVVGPERFTLIVADESDRMMLHRTFEGLLGLPTGTLENHADRSNRSLSWPETELLRAVNRELATLKVGVKQRRVLVKGGLIADMNARVAPPAGPRTPPLPSWAAEQVRAISDRRVADLERSGCRIVGEVSSLLVPDDVPVGDPAELPAVSVETAASAVVAAATAARRPQLDRSTAGEPRREAPPTPDPPPGLVDRLARRLKRAGTTS